MKRWTSPSVALLGVALFIAACSEPLEFADWTIAVPEGTRIIEYAPVPLETRDPNAIELTEELVIGGDLSEVEASVFQASHVVGTADGTMFVADASRNHVQMYDREGRYQRTLGREGQGPGEFSSISSMTIAGDLLVIDDSRNDRFSSWTLRGEHVRDYRKESAIARTTETLAGLTDETIIATAEIWEPSGQEVAKSIVARFSLEARELNRLDEMVPAPRVIPDRSWSSAQLVEAIIGLFDSPARFYVVGAQQSVYLTPVHEYQVLSFFPDGRPHWALRVAWPHPAVSSLTKQRVLRQAARDDTRLDESDFDWPDGYRVVAHLLADGAGRLYVMLEQGFDGESPSQLPADVYSPQGDLVAAGFLPALWEFGNVTRVPWSHAAGDYVYGLRRTDAGETVAVRHRLTVKER